MYVLCVTIHVTPESIDNFIVTTSRYAAQVRQEYGNVKYDLLQSEDGLTCFVIYEAYKSKEEFLRHRETAHAVEWKEIIGPCMARPRQRIRCNSIIFGND